MLSFKPVVGAMHDLLDFVGEIYEAAYRPEHWDQVAEGLCQLMDAKSGAIFLEDHESNIREMVGVFGLPAAVPLSYKLGLSKYDVTFQMQRNEPAGVARQLVDSQEMKASHPLYYRMLLKPNDVAYLGAMNIFNDDEWHIGVGLHRGSNKQAFNKQELEKLELLQPHFQRALRIYKEFRNLRSQRQTLEAALNRFMLGVIVVNPDNTLHYCNPVAQNFLHDQLALRINHEQKLQAHMAQENIALYQAIDSLRALDKKSRKPKQMALSVHHPNKEHGLHILAVRMDEDSDNPLVGLYLADPELSFNLPPSALQSLYGMTPTEANVAIALANGASTRQISEQHHVSIETVKTQLKNIYSKMGVNKQQDVVRLLLSGVLRAN